MRRDFGPGPHFLCIGAQKAGTTWLHRNLVRHPDVWMPMIKEFHYFDGNRRSPVVAEKIELYLRQVDAGERQFTPEVFAFMQRLARGEPKDDDWYLSLFEFAKGRLCGDMTPAYSTLDAEVVSRVRRLLPSCRILFVMRNPVERAWSQTRMELRRDGLDPAAMSLADLLPYVDDPRSERRTSYMKTIRTWESVYSASQIRYLFYDQIRARPKLFLAHVCAFLGLSYNPAVFARTWRTVYNKSPPVPMPPLLRRHLADKYRDEIAALAARFGPPAATWLASCEKTLKDA
jgi:hypothetical protein